MDMVERVARALFDVRMQVAVGAKLHEPYAWEEENNVYREHCLREARTVIEAMREPTDEMAVAVGVQYDSGFQDGWYKMIDAALVTHTHSGEPG